MQRAIELVGQASNIFDELGTEPFVRQAGQLGGFRGRVNQSRIDSARDQLMSNH